MFDIVNLLFLTLLGVRWDAGFSLAAPGWGCSLSAAGGLLAVASLAAERGLYRTRAQKLLLHGSVAQARELWRTGVVAPRHVESSQFKDQTRLSCTGRRTLRH